MKKKNWKIAHSNLERITKMCPFAYYTIGSAKTKMHKSSNSKFRIPLRKETSLKTASILIRNWVQAKRIIKNSRIMLRRTFTSRKLGMIALLKKLNLKKTKQSARSNQHFTPKRVKELLQYAAFSLNLKITKFKNNKMEASANRTIIGE